MANWGWKDGWILAATVLEQNNGAATLAEVIGAADAINHAIPTNGELSRAFSRLISCGVLQIENERYIVSKDYLSEIREALKSRGGLFRSADKCLKWLKDGGFEFAGPEEVTVSESEVAAAYESYCKALKRRK